MKKIVLFVALMVGVVLTSCNLDYFPSDELNSDVLLQDEAGAEYIMDGCYSLLKDEVEFLGYSSGNSFVRHYFQMSEFPADNTCLSSHTTDPLYEATALKMTDNLKNVGTLWMVAYKVIYMTNTVIESTEEGASATSDHLLGEAYFVRAWMHFNLVNLYAKPYSHGRDNIGVPLHISTNNPEPFREKVGPVYDQIVKDLTKASQLMGASRGNAGYPSKDAALGLLSRVHLYMGSYDEVINTVNTMLGGATPASKLDADLANYFINAKTSSETLLCIAHEPTETPGQSGIGSMYINDGMGWGEIYPTSPLLYLYERYPMDLRYTSFIHPQYPDPLLNSTTVYFPDPETADDASGRLNLSFVVTPDGENYKFTDGGKTYIVEKKTVNGGYFEYHVNYKGEDCLARVHETMKNRNTNPIYYISKFSYQDGDPMLSSPVICRWGEVILNRAEAYAQLGQDAKAYEDVNVIRKRAGIPADGMFSTSDKHGYASALDVVLDERRLELAFEAHRLFDLIRNKKDVDRKFPGAQPWEIVKHTDDRFQYPIPNNEWTVSGIQQNPGY